MTTAGQIGIDLILNSTSFKKSLNNIQTKANNAGTKISKAFSSSINSTQAQINSAGSKISNSFGKIAKVVGTAFSVAMITRFSKECVSAANIQTEAETKLTTVMRQRMSASNKAISSVKNYASALQETGVVGDEVQLAGAQQLSTFLKTDDALKKLMPAMNNLAVQQNGVNVTSESMVNIGNLMGKVMQGQTSALTRVGITFSDAQAQVLKYGNEEQRAAMLSQVITDNVGNMNKALANTPAGRIQQLKNSFGDMQETLGRGLNNVFSPMLGFLTKIVTKLSQVASGFENLTKKIFGDSNSEQSSAGMNNLSTGADNATTSVDNNTKAINNNAKAKKKAERSLANFDKLNVLTKTDSNTSSSNNTSSTATGGNTPSKKKPNSNNKTNPKFNFSKLYKESGLENFFSKVQRGIDKVDWSAIGNNCKNIFKKSIPIAKAYLGQVQNVSKSALGAVGSFVGGIVQVGGKQLQTLTGGISKWLTKDQGKIIGFINTIGTHLSNGFDNLSTFFDGAFDLLGDSIDRVRPTMENAISNLLSGITDLAGGVGTIVSDSFEIATGKLVEWVEQDSETIGTFFDNIQLQIADVLSLVGTVFSDIGIFLSEWWESDGSSVFSNICDMFTNIGTTLMNVYNEWIKPAWDAIVDIFQSAWDNCLKPIFEKAVSFFGKLGDCISAIWNNFLSPIVNFLVKTFGPVFTNIFKAIGGVFNTVFTVIGDVVGGILDALGGLLDFITGIFTGDWKKAWNGIKDFFKGIWDGIWGIIKGVINLIIDGINMLWTGIYNAVSAIVNAVGGIAGAIGDVFGQDWNFSMPEKVPLIPHLAKGGLVKAPTLAVVGDNMGASSGNPEVVSPLNKLKGMIQESSDNGDTEILSQILLYLKRMYEMFIIFRNKGGNTYEFVAKINGSDIFKEIVKQNEMYKKRHNGKSAFV
jgi:phage-related protein